MCGQNVEKTDKLRTGDCNNKVSVEMETTTEQSSVRETTGEANEETVAGEENKLAWEITDKNLAVPLWEILNSFLKSLGKNLMKPMEAFGKVFKNQENELVLCALFWLWIPILAAYMFAVAVVFCAAVAVTAILGFSQSLVFLLIGLWPGFVIMLGVTGISILRTPWNIYYHCLIAHRDLRQGHPIKGVSFLLLLPAQLLLPLLVALSSISAVAVSGVLAFFGCPQIPWRNISHVLHQFWGKYVTILKEKVQNYSNEEISENYSTQYWMHLQEICKDLIWQMFQLPSPLFKQISKLPECGMATTVITVFSPLLLPFFAVYILIFALFVCIIVLPFTCIGVVQSLLHLLFGIWPGVILPLEITARGVIQTPWNIAFHCQVIGKSLQLEEPLKAVTLTLLLPAQLLLPPLLLVCGLPAGLLTCSAISLLGCPQVAWRAMADVRQQARAKLVTEVSAWVSNYGTSGGEPSDRNYGTDYWQCVGVALTTFGQIASAPFAYKSEASESQLRTILCSPIWIPLAIAYFLLSALTLCAVAGPLISVGLLQNTIFLLLGFWPGFIIAGGVTAISILRIPWNIYYHIIVTFRTVMLRPNLKMASIILVPPTHFLVPVVIGAISFGVCIPVSAIVSFAGCPQKPWGKVEHLLKKFWQRYVTDMQAHVQNYGHESGIPENWDGRIYGLALDPITIVMSILFYVYAVIPITLGIIAMVVTKAPLVLIYCLKEYWKVANYFKGVNRWAETIKKLFQYKALEEFCSLIKKYFNWVKHIDPSMLPKSIKGYSDEYSMKECIPKRGCEKFCLSPCILLVSLFWISGLLGVILITIFSIVLGFIGWVFCWTFVLLVPPVIYLCTWFGLVFLVPIFATIMWILCLIIVILTPWPVLAFILPIGPFLALKVPYCVLEHNVLNPAEMDISFQLGLRMPLEILKEADRLSRAFIFPKWTFWNHPVEDEADLAAPGGAVRRKAIKGDRREIDYWELFFQRSTMEVRQVLGKNWLTHDDIAEASATSMIAIPGFTISSILVESIARDKIDRSLIYWDERNQCTKSSTNRQDNIANHFYPMLMKIKNGLRGLDDMDQVNSFLASSFCDGADEKTEELQNFLESQQVSDDDKKKYLAIRSELENLVHSLLRVKKMQETLSKICQHDFKVPPKLRKDSEPSSPSHALIQQFPTLGLLHSVHPLMSTDSVEPGLRQGSQVEQEPEPPSQEARRTASDASDTPLITNEGLEMTELRTDTTQL